MLGHLTELDEFDSSLIYIFVIKDPWTEYQRNQSICIYQPSFSYSHFISLLFQVIYRTLDHLIFFLFPLKIIIRFCDRTKKYVSFSIFPSQKSSNFICGSHLLVVILLQAILKPLVTGLILSFQKIIFCILSKIV